MEQEGELNQLEVEAMAENFISIKLNDHPLIEHLPVIPLRSLKKVIESPLMEKLW